MTNVDFVEGLVVSSLSSDSTRASASAQDKFLNAKQRAIAARALDAASAGEGADAGRAAETIVENNPAAQVRRSLLLQ